MVDAYLIDPDLLRLAICCSLSILLGSGGFGLDDGDVKTSRSCFALLGLCILLNWCCCCIR